MQDVPYLNFLADDLVSDDRPSAIRNCPEAGCKIVTWGASMGEVSKLGCVGIDAAGIVTGHFRPRLLINPVI